MREFVRTGRPPQETGHGTRYMYTCKRCRCEACKVAWSTYQKAWRRKLKLADADYVVSAELARKHLERLSKAGVGFRTVAEYTATQPQYIQAIRTGRRKRIRMSTEQRIMRIRPDAHADCGIIDAGPTKKLIGEILDSGYNKTTIARLLGSKCKEPTLQMGDRIIAKTAQKVRRLHKELVVGKVERMMRLATGRAA